MLNVKSNSMRFGGLRAVRSPVVTGADLDASVFIVCVVWVCYVGNFFLERLLALTRGLANAKGTSKTAFA